MNKKSQKTSHAADLLRGSMDASEYKHEKVIKHHPDSYPQNDI